MYFSTHTKILLSTYISCLLCICFYSLKQKHNILNKVSTNKMFLNTYTVQIIRCLSTRTQLNCLRHFLWLQLFCTPLWRLRSRKIELSTDWLRFARNTWRMRLSIRSWRTRYFLNFWTCYRQWNFRRAILKHVKIAGYKITFMISWA